MIEKEVLYGSDAKFKLKKGVDAVANAVKVTLGPAGRNVIIEDERGLPHISKDGVTVANSITLSDPIENLGASVIKQASSKSADNAGDGTTTATVLAQAIVSKAMSSIASGTNITLFKKGMEACSKDVVNILKKKSKKVNKTTLKSVSRISANNDNELGSIIAEAYSKVGKNGVVTMEESLTSKTYVDVIDGTKINKGYASPYLITNREKHEAVLDNPLVFISDQEIKSMDEIISILEVVTRNKRSLLIISDMDDSVLNALNVNKAKGLIKVNVVKPEGVGIKRFELLQDLCVLTGALLASDETGNDLSTVDSSYLGQAIKCVSTEKDTVIITDREAFKEEIEDTIKSVNEAIQKAENKLNLWHYKDRLSRLCGGVAVVYVGAETEVEMREKKDRVDDAIKAVKSALEEGVVAGGGVCLYEIQEEINKNVDLYIENPSHFVDGYLCVLDALSAPIENILKNASVDFENVSNTISERGFGYGYDVVNEVFGDMFAIGVIDATKVTRNAVQNAVSVSATLLTTECTITNKRA